MAKRKARRKAKRKVKKKKGKGKPFGGMVICPDKALGAVLGKACVSPAQMTKKLWQYIKRKRLVKRK